MTSHTIDPILPVKDENMLACVIYFIAGKRAQSVSPAATLRRTEVVSSVIFRY